MWWRTPWLRQRWLLLSLAFWDALLLGSFYNLLFRQQFRRWPGLTGSILALILLWIASSYLLGRYSRPIQGQHDSQRHRLFSTACLALLILGGIVVILNWGLKLEDPRTFRGFILPYLVSVSAASAAAQLIATRILRRKRSWILVGNSTEIRVLAQELELDQGSHQLNLHYCDSESLTSIGAIQQVGIDAIAVSEISRLDDSLLEDLLALRSRGASLCSLVIWAEQHLQRVPPELFSSRWLVQAEGFELRPDRWGWRLKRLGDVVVAILLLITTTPILIIAALFIRLEDGGSILYTQKRTGLYGEVIKVWKLRTMAQASESDGPKWASRDDPRITNICCSFVYSYTLHSYPVCRP